MDSSIEFCIGVAEGLVANLGFPIFVAVWVLVVQKKATNRLTAAINSLTRAFEKANIQIKNEKEGGDI